MKQMPKGNIFWKDIPEDACVIDHRSYFEVKHGRKRYVANWSSRDARKAQSSLLKMAKKRCKR